MYRTSDLHSKVFDPHKLKYMLPGIMKILKTLNRDKIRHPTSDNCAKRQENSSIHCNKLKFVHQKQNSMNFGFIVYHTIHVSSAHAQ